MAIFDQEESLVGLTGPSTSRKAALDARLFAAAPNLLSMLKYLCTAVTDHINTLPKELDINPEPQTILWDVVRQAEQLTREFEYNEVY
jgi:hypothetical protein